MALAETWRHEEPEDDVSHGAGGLPIRLTGVDKLAGLLGGFHLGGPGFESIIEPTVSALRDLAPDVVVSAHCTGWRAQHRLAAELPEAFVPNAVGTTITVAA